MNKNVFNISPFIQLTGPKLYVITQNTSVILIYCDIFTSHLINRNPRILLIVTLINNKYVTLLAIHYRQSWASLIIA